MDARDKKSREAAIAELKVQIEAQRARIDPDVLKKAEKAAAASQNPKPKAELVPFDRDAAALVVRLFLDRHDDPEWFKRQLQEQLKKER